MKFELNNLPRNASKEEIITEIKRVDNLLNKEKIITKDFNNLSKITAKTAGKAFGGWENALIAAGLGHKYSGIRVSEKMRQQSKKLTDEEVLNELKRIAEMLGQNFVTQESLNSHSEIISATTVVYRFGSYEEGIKRAGLENSPGYRRRYSNEEYFENLLNVWTKHGRQPFLREMSEEPSNISPGAYESRFGSWRKALEAFVERMNQGEKEDEQISQDNEKVQSPIREEIKKTSVASENRRSIGLGLRYKILNRDKFKCVRCGSSPATDLTCKLHIDHIVPFSKRGKTTFDNLQTLCEKCNLGKGNRHME